MNETHILTLFLTVSGAFVFCCALKNYDWFFNLPGPSRFFIMLVGRKRLRVVYLALSVVLLGWGAARIYSPPPHISTGFVSNLAEPAGIDLAESPDAVTHLLKASREVRDLMADQSGWVSFWMRLDSNAPYFAHALASTKAGADFHEGFAFGTRMLGDRRLDGRILYFDKDRVSCDNVIFSDHPLSSAHFAVVICTPESSEKNGFVGALSLFYCRAGSDLYERLIR